MRVALLWIGAGLVTAVTAVAALVAWADRRFQGATDAEARALLATVASMPPSTVTADEVAALPPPVRRWLEGAGVVGRPRPRVVRLQQRGMLRAGPDQPPTAAMAEQVFTVDEPGFVWSVRLRLLRVVPIVGRDTYRDGRGRMLISAAAIVPVVDASGDAIDQGALLRFLGEIVWFPGAAVAPYLRWDGIDDRSARATMSHGGVTASAVFTFDDDGRFVRLDARRYYGGGPEAVLRDWSVTASRWAEQGGVRIPVEGVVTWHLPDGDFEFYRWEILGLAY